MKELAMQRIARIYLPLSRKSEWPKVHVPKIHAMGLARSFAAALELYGRAMSVAYITALRLEQPNEHLHDEDLEGRDPRW